MSSRRARDLEHVYPSGPHERLSRERRPIAATATGVGIAPAVGVATYAQRIKNKKTSTRKTASRPAAKASPAAVPKPEPAAPPVEPGELQRLKDELQRVNQGISKIARVGGPDAARQSSLPEKQELLRQKIDLERKIRAVSKT